MISADCDLIRDDLDLFVDGELRGEELRRVSQHIEACRHCTDEIEARRNVGVSVREALLLSQSLQVPQGLASGIVTRIRAESAQSWRALFGRAVEDWHWAIVGGGAVAATFVSALICSALLVFGTVAPRAGSLSALGTSLRESPGALYAEVSRAGALRPEVMLVQLETSDTPLDPDPYPSVFNRDRGDEEREMVHALAETLAAHGGGIDLSSMSPDARKRAEWLFDNIVKLRGAETTTTPFGALRVYRLHLVTNTEVTAKGLWP